MKTLADILSINNEIKEIAAKLGLQNIKIFHQKKNSHDFEKLELIVESIPNTSISYKNPIYFSAILSEKLKCKVTVTVKESINELYKNHFFENSASLDDEKRLCELFNTSSLNEIRFHSISQNKNEKALGNALLIEANMALKKNLPTYENLNNFSLLSNNSKKDISKNNDEERIIEKYGQEAFHQLCDSKKEITEADIVKFLTGFKNSAETNGHNFNTVIQILQKNLSSLSIT